MDKEKIHGITKKDFVEVVSRRKNGKISAITKCQLVSKNDEINNRIANSILKNSSYSMDNVRALMNNANSNTALLNKQIQNLSINFDSAFQSLKNISYINTGLSLVNTAVDIAGFIVLSKKLNIIKENLISLDVKIDNLLNYNKNDLIEEYEKYIMESNSVHDKLINKKTLDLDAVNSLIIGLKAFISKLLNSLKEHLFDSDFLVEMIYTLVPAYTFLLNEYLKRYYYDNQSFPTNYDIFMSIFDELSSIDIKKKMMDHLVLKNRMHIIEAQDVINAHLLCALNNRVLIEDNVKVIKAFKTEEKMFAYENMINNIAKDAVLREVSTISQDSGIDKEEGRIIIENWFK